MRRSSLTQISRRSYIHTFCCLAEHNADKVPSVVLKAELLASGLCEQKVTSQENSCCPSGPNVSCITCENAVPFSEIKVPRVSCNG
ncbi:hypothetical protein GOODEAATRI_032499, partial [Goodea atripinnis]